MQLIHLECCSFSALCPDDSSKILLCSEGLSFVPILKNTTLPWKRAIFSQYPRYSVQIAYQNVISHLNFIILLWSSSILTNVFDYLDHQTLHRKTAVSQLYQRPKLWDTHCKTTNSIAIQSGFNLTQKHRKPTG